MEEDTQKQMLDQLIAWCEINSGSYNLLGLERMENVLASAFGELGGVVERISLPEVEVFTPEGERIWRSTGRALRIRKRPEAPIQVLLCGHMDTVFGPEHPFQTVSFSEDGLRIIGPGVADMKGGLAILLYALKELEAGGQVNNLGWEVLIVPDEEIGSGSMERLFAEAAVRNQFGLIFEPTLSDGALVRCRKGSGNFNCVVRGRAAHAGRAFKEGRNAIAGLADWIQQVHALNREFPKAVFNVGRIMGGGPLNVVPDRAAAQFNIRISSNQERVLIEKRLNELAEAFSRDHDGMQLTWDGRFLRPPKEIGNVEEQLFREICEVVAIDGERLTWRDTGGCCDGNNLSACGLPNIDTMGVRGGNLHQDGEFAVIDSLPQRVRLVVTLLERIARRARVER